MRAFAGNAVHLGRRLLGPAARGSGLTRTLLVIAGIGVAWFGWDVTTNDGPPSGGDRFTQIDAYVLDRMDDSRIPGVAIAIVENGSTVHAAGYGDDGRGNPITAETPFWIGSNTKSITALATMQLVENGTLDLDAPVQQYLPEFTVADSEASAQITIRHLLNQTSGLSRIDSIKTVAAGKDQTLDEAVADVADLELNRPVGETFEYANLNSVVLGLVIERVTELSWQNYVQANIFDPLAMTRTYTTKEAAEANGLTTTHRYFFGFPHQTDGKHLMGLAPTGYVYSTANDMARYLAMYRQGGTLDGNQILSEQGIAEMLTAATNQRTFQLQSQSFTARYGTGWFIGPFGAAQDARWHQGSLPHFTGWMVQLPDTGQAIVVLINAGNQCEIGGANATWSRIPQGIVNILRDQPPPTGTGTARFFIIFNTAAAAAVVAQAWSLARVLTNPVDHHRSRLRAAAPLVWEIGGAGLLLIGYPILFGGLGWRTTYGVVPDLTIAVAVIAGLALLTGIARLARLVAARREATPSGRPQPPIESAPEGSRAVEPESPAPLPTR